jgi:hypothetical protein
LADSAFQVAYRNEFVAGFEQHKSLLNKRVTTDFEMVKGGSAVFLVADSGGASAVTRGVNGLIPARADNLAQNTVTLTEWHDLVRKTSFNVFASQGDQRRIMQMTSQAVMNRKIDSDIIAELDAGATLVTNSTATTASVPMVIHAKTVLGNNKVPLGKNITALITPAFEGYLAQTKEFEHYDYVGMGPNYFTDGEPDYDDEPYAFFKMGVLWIVHPGLTGIGTSSASCYMFHRSALGHATDVKGLQSLIGYFEEQDYSWARTTAFLGTKTLQVNGIVKMLHDDSALSSST